MGKIHNVLEKKGLSSEVIKTSYRPLFNNNDFDDAYVSTSIRELAHKVDILLYIVKGMAQCPNEIYHLADINNSSPRKTIDFFYIRTCRFHFAGDWEKENLSSHIGIFTKTHINIFRNFIRKKQNS